MIATISGRIWRLCGVPWIDVSREPMVTFGFNSWPLENRRRLSEAILELIPYVSESAKVARYFRAPSFYAHASNADTLPTTLLEALACDTPTIAPAVGGIPEQIRPLELPAFSVGWPTYSMVEATGISTESGDGNSLANAMVCLGRDVNSIDRLGCKARLDAERHCHVRRQVDADGAWYRHMLECLCPSRKVAQ